MNERRTYSQEQKAEAMARMLAGEGATQVGADLQIEPATLRSWLSREPALQNLQHVATLPQARTRDAERSERVKDDFSDLLHAKMVALTRQAEHYGTEKWIQQQNPDRLLESTRTLWKHVLAAVDRMAGRAEAEGEDERQASE